jgi:hypothetical protein
MTNLNLLQAPYIHPTRRNHALEHASLHVLSARFPNTPMGGHSNPTGFFIVGKLPTEQVREAVGIALSRLQNGEAALAIHPGCGTNYAVTGGLAALAALYGFIGTKQHPRTPRAPAAGQPAVHFCLHARPGPRPPPAKKNHHRPRPRRYGHRGRLPGHLQFAPGGDEVRMKIERQGNNLPLYFHS